MRKLLPHPTPPDHALTHRSKVELEAKQAKPPAPTAQLQEVKTG